MSHRELEAPMAKPKRLTYFKAVLTDKPGALLTVLREFKSKNIALAGLWGYATAEGKADLYVVAKKPDQVRNAWKASGMLADEGMGFFLSGTDKTGVLLGALQALEAASVNIIAMDAVVVSGKYGSFVWVAPADVEKAAKALGTK